MTKSTITRERATDKEIQMLIASHENGTAMFLRVDAYYLMAKELQECRKAEQDSEPVFILEVARADYKGQKLGNHFGFITLDAARELKEGNYQLYRHAQQPVVPDRSIFEKWWESQNGAPLDGWDSLRATDGYYDDGIDGQFEAWNACRAAMLQAGNSPVIPDGKSVTASTGIPVIPDGYVIVPKEPTEAMMLHKSGCQHHAWDDPDCAMRQTRRLIWSHMLAAAPHDTPALNSVQSVVTVPGKWIQVSERMPENDVSVLTFDGMYRRVHHAMYGHWQCSGQLKLATVLEFFQYRFSDSFGGNPPL